jgi:hypothetical protein
MAAKYAIKAEKINRSAELQAKLAEWKETVSDEDLAVITALFQGYSARNACLIALQAPNATEVHGFKAWLELGRCVRKGEKGIGILAPAGQGRGVEAKPSTETETATEGKSGRQFFRVAYVFAREQTDVVVPKPAVRDEEILSDEELFA